MSPLPAIPVGESYAYGSVGRVHIDTQVPAANGTQFSSQFAATRGTAVTRDAPVPAQINSRSTGRRSRQSSAAPSAPSPQKSPRKKPAAALDRIEENIRVAIDDDDNDDDDEDDEDDDLNDEIPIGDYAYEERDGSVDQSDKDSSTLR